LHVVEVPVVAAISASEKQAQRFELSEGSPNPTASPESAP
jgi:hypothetical protein